jgi:hypothetical protein
MSNVAHMNDEISMHDFLKRSAERGDELGREIGNETHGVGQDRLVPAPAG